MQCLTDTGRVCGVADGAESSVPHMLGAISEMLGSLACNIRADDNQIFVFGGLVL